MRKAALLHGTLSWIKTVGVGVYVFFCGWKGRRVCQFKKNMFFLVRQNVLWVSYLANG